MRAVLYEQMCDIMTTGITRFIPPPTHRRATARDRGHSRRRKDPTHVWRTPAGYFGAPRAALRRPPLLLAPTTDAAARATMTGDGGGVPSAEPPPPPLAPRDLSASFRSSAAFLRPAANACGWGRQAPPQSTALAQEGAARADLPLCRLACRRLLR